MSLEARVDGNFCSSACRTDFFSSSRNNGGKIGESETEEDLREEYADDGDGEDERRGIAVPSGSAE